jgi:hypothetical protein
LRRGQAAEDWPHSMTLSPCPGPSCSARFWSAARTDTCTANPKKRKSKKHWVTSCETSNACNMEPFEPKVASLALVSSRRAAKPLSAAAANNRECSGRSRAPRTSWPYAASTAAADLMSSGNTASTNTPLATTPWRSRPNGRILSHAPGCFSAHFFIDKCYPVQDDCQL